MRLTSVLAVALLAGCAGSASERAQPSPPPVPATVASAPLASPSPSLPASLPAAPAPVPSPPADDVPVAPDAEGTRAFPTVAALCAAYLETVAARRHELEEAAKFVEIPLARPTCQRSERRLGVRFVGDRLYKRAFFLERSDGLVTQLRVIAELPRGLVTTSIGWETIDPLDPGCPCIPQTESLHALRVENGYLLAVLNQEVHTIDEEGEPVNKSILGATWCRESGAALRCQTYDSQNEPPLKRFTIDARGALVAAR